MWHECYSLIDAPERLEIAAASLSLWNPALMHPRMLNSQRQD